MAALGPIHALADLDDFNLEITVSLVLVLAILLGLVQTLDDVLLRVLPLVSFQQADQPDHLILNLVIRLGLVGELDDGVGTSIS